MKPKGVLLLDSVPSPSHLIMCVYIFQNLKNSRNGNDSDSTEIREVEKPRPTSTRVHTHTTFTFDSRSTTA